jgi:sec-independent protein translocase protein TatB
MFSIAHIVIIFVVALVVFGPEKLPDLARNLGKVMGEFRRATGDLRSTFESHMRDLEREAELRKVRETTAAQAPNLPAAEVTGVDAENSIGGGSQTAALPLSTPEATATVDPADLVKDLPPPPGTVQSDRPNASAFAEPEAPSTSPQQLEFETPTLHTGEQPNPDSEKASDVRSRPA